MVNNSDTVPLPLIWDTMKAVLQGSIISISAHLKREKNRIRVEALSRLATLEKEHKRTGDKQIYTQILAERKILDSIEIPQIQKNLLFLKQRLWQKSAKNIKILAWRVKERKNSAQVKAIRSPNGNTQYLPSEIAQSFATYYKKLYSSENPSLRDIQDYLEQADCYKQISPDHSAYLDKPFTKEELHNTIKALKPNKAPGTDGLPSEFYRTFQSSLVDHLLKVCNNVLLTGELPPSWTESNIVVIPKDPNKATDPKAYRPIALLNNDAKIFTTLLANRLKMIIPEYVADDQTGFIPGRQLTDNIRRTLNIISHGKRTSQESLVLALDFEKAFDSLEIGYLLCLLNKMGFGNVFLRALQAIYTQPKSRVRVNGCNSEFFHPSRGTRQGCPLSPLLFAIAMEPLAEVLRKNKAFSGVTIGKREHKVSLYADDLTLYVSDPVNSLSAILDSLSQFGLVSGLKLNSSKSELFPISLSASVRQILKTNFPFCWTKQSWRHLGAQIPLDLNNLMSCNLDRLYRDTQL